MLRGFRLVAFSVCLGLLLWGSGGCQSPSKTPQIRSQAVIGGVIDNRHPAVGALTYNKTPFCTATLIAGRIVLTAAHCVDTARIAVQRGTVHFRIDKPTGQSNNYTSSYHAIEPALMTNHPNWTRSLSNGYDVAIVVLKKSVTGVQPILYNRKALSTAQWKGKKALFIGYGLIKSSPKAVAPGRKYSAEIEMTDIQSDRIKSYVKGKSICHGDSGGPVLVTINNRLYTIGVNSYVVANLVPGSSPLRTDCSGTGFSARTDSYNTFIQAYLLKYGDGDVPCGSDTDCGGCAVCGTKQACVPKVVPENLTLCKGCKTDDDCGSGGICHLFNEGYRCLQRCDGGGCCPKGSVCQEIRVKGVIRKACMRTCPLLTCTTVADCGPGEECASGTCIPKRPERTKEVCTSCFSSGDCGKGNTCVNSLSTMGYCSQACGLNQFCPEGFSCQTLANGLQQCLPRGDSCQQTCDDKTPCPTGFQCQSGKCVPQKTGQEGSPCDDKTPCADSFLKCLLTDGSKGLCVRSCNAPVGEAGSVCDKDKKCREGLQCLPGPNGTNVCLELCSGTCPSGGRCENNICSCLRTEDCGPGRFCNKVVLGERGTCAPIPKNNPCKAGLICRSLAGYGSVCLPQKGDASHGQNCSPLRRCKPGLRCIALATTGSSVCVQECSKDSTCQKGGRCVNFGEGTKLCFCANSGECAKDSTCETALQTINGSFGVCKVADTTQCRNRDDCPSEHLCNNGKCVYSAALRNEPFVKAEPLREPTPEPVVDAGDSGASEPAPKPDNKKPTTEPDDDGPYPEWMKKDRKQEKEGCSCSATSQEPGGGMFVLMLLFLTLGWSRKKRG